MAMLNSSTLFTATRSSSKHRQRNIAVPWQQWLSGSVTVLLYVYIAYLVLYLTFVNFCN